MAAQRVVLADRGAGFSEPGRAVLRRAGLEVVDAELQEGRAPIEVIREADALLVFWYPVTADVIGQLTRCRVIVRNGVGVDNVDLAAAAAAGIPVCNVPDYCVDEVADHAFALALTLARQISSLDRLVRAGGWQPELPYPMPSLGRMTFVTIGLGRIARATLARARPFRFTLAAYDPYVSEAAFAEAGVRRLTLDQAFEEADILSLHCPLTPEMRHVVDAGRLARMKPGAILVNASRGALIDTGALARALQERTIAAAGLDVFETEPLPADHPIRDCPTALLSPHFAWHSSESGVRLHEMAAAEVVRCLGGEAVLHCVNREALGAAKGAAGA